MKSFPAVQLLAVEGMPIFEQLQLEEALMRTSGHNYCLINHNSTPAIVMGISGKPDELIDPEHYAKTPIPIIRRFSGGGCVLIGPDTLFLTFIFNKSDVDVGTCPQKLLQWTEELLLPAFGNIGFKVRENDYVVGDTKFGGNAQYFTKDRWLHHTSLLWDFSTDDMKILKMPPKIPEYRKRRDHGNFLCRLNEHFESKEIFFDNVQTALAKQCSIQEKNIHADARAYLQTSHRKATEFVDWKQ